MRSLHGLNDWQGLGLKLGIDFATLEDIDRENSGDLDQCKTALLCLWLQSRTATKTALVNALTYLGEHAIASILQ